MYKVLVHNDDYTTMEFVVMVLRVVFFLDEAQSTSVMLHVHRNGSGVAGVYTLSLQRPVFGKRPTWRDRTIIHSSFLWSLSK